MPFTLDSTTADNYGEALLAWFKDRKQIITIDTKIGTAEYNALEVGDIINFDNWDSNLSNSRAAILEKLICLRETEQRNREQGIYTRW